LTAVIEERWEKRFGGQTISGLQRSLRELAANLGEDLPNYLPILGFELLSQGPERGGKAPSGVVGTPLSECTIPILLSKVLLAFAIEFERDFKGSLAIAANVLRLVGDDGVRVRDLPRLSGVSKEAIDWALKRSEERGKLSIQTESPGSRVKVVVLTPEGQKAREAYGQHVWAIEERWRAKFGDDAVSDLRKSLEPLVAPASGTASLLFQGIEPYPDGWRAKVPKREVLPHYPMVLHRGGFPDGS
jgi:DNA-binding MarR family transcriptional regulator